MKFALSIISLFVFLASCMASQKNEKSVTLVKDHIMTDTNKTETITLGAGCFWCVETIFLQLEGVSRAQSGYSGGKVNNPTYKEVCSGLTGHAEVVQVDYDPTVISLSEILEVFWKVHDPTTLNKQGNDVGTQYRSAVFYHNEEQQKVADELKVKLNASGAYSNPIVTEVTAFSNFYPAEDYHNDYYNLHGEEPYCKFVIQPKVEKFQKVFKEKLKK